MTLVVPMYNEERRIGECALHLIDFVESWSKDSRLIFVDDGSSDATLEKLNVIIEESGSRRVCVLRRPHEGKGSALRSGLLHSNTELAGFCDLDLATPLRELNRLFTTSYSLDALVIGSRSHVDAHVIRHESKKRELAGRAFNKFVQMLICPGIKDTQCGAKVAPSWIWNRILLDSKENGFAWDVEVISSALRTGITVLEMGVHWSHDERSKVNVKRDGVSMVLAVMKLKSRQLAQSRSRVITMRS